MNNKTAPNPSLREVIVRNPGFAVHPLEWTADQLELVHCRFQDIDAPPETKEPVHRQVSFNNVQELLQTYSSRSEAFMGLFLNDASPFEHMEGKPCFHFERRGVTLPDCHVFVTKSSASEETVIPTAPPVVAFLDYDIVIRTRELRFAPNYSGPRNDPIWELNKRKHRLCTPKIWNRDPYLLCVLLSLAQYSHELFDSARYPARIIVYESSDKVDAHVFHAEFPRGILEQLLFPANETDATWPTIYHTKIPFEPYGTFADRVITHILDVKFETEDQRNEAGGKTAQSEISIRTAALA